MYATIKQDTNKIEIMLAEPFTRDEFIQVIHQLESLCAMYQEIHGLMDGLAVKKIDFQVEPKEFELYKKYASHVGQVAVLSHTQCASFFHDFFAQFADCEFKTFSIEQSQQARNWVFPSKLPKPQRISEHSPTRC